MRALHAVLPVAILLGSIAACGSDGVGGGPEADGGSPDVPADGPPAWANAQGERRAALPKQAPAKTTFFTTSDACAQCHTAGDGKVMRDAKGRDISPVTTFRPSMMSMAARDPFYLAVVDEERSARPGAEALIDGACTKCHAPAAVIERGLGGKGITIPELFTGQDPEMHAGREGATCTVCHQTTKPQGLVDATFGGAFSVGENREIYGPHQGPTTDPMKLFVSYVPTYSDHVTRSELCASCHTVFTRAHDVTGKATGPRLPEQVTYLEWRNSVYASTGASGASCQSCHMPVGDDDGVPISAVLSKIPPTGLGERKPIGRHSLLGGNVTMLRAFSDDGGWSGASAESAAFKEQADRTVKNLETAAKLTVGAPRRTARGLEVDVTVENRTGHKLPTGYPSRRAWLYVKVQGPAGYVFESGRSDAFGRIVDRAGHVLGKGTYFPHRDTITRDDEVLVYEAVLGNDKGEVVTRPLDATRYLKDNRLLPLGWSKDHPDGPITTSFGPERDPDFSSSDTVHLVLANVPEGAVEISAELRFQSLRPSELDGLALYPTPTARTLFDMVKTKLEPVVIAKATKSGP
ncbi:MAG: hypothetical protein U0183_09840 [Polyangiaceae bacterium]